MIGKTFPFGKGFLGLTRYLETGSAGEERDRVAWIESRNLPTKDPEAAARLMAATARESVLTQRPVYHVAISFDPGDRADRERMRGVADAVLRSLGLTEHQVLIVAHNDTAHPHMHLVVNRVHPVEHKAWENSWDWPKIEQALRAKEAELGLRVVPGKHAPVPGRVPQRGLARGDAAFLHRVNEQAAPVLAHARSWAEVERGLADARLAVRVKGGGLTIHDGRQEVKASDVGREFSRSNLEKRLGTVSSHRFTVRLDVDGPALSASAEPERKPVRASETQPEPPAAPPAAADTAFQAFLRVEEQRLREAGLRLKLRRAADLFREAESIQSREEAAWKCTSTAEAAASEVKRLKDLKESATAADERLSSALRNVYEDPEAAFKALRAHQQTNGLEATRRAIREKPDSFGDMKGVRPLWGVGLVKHTDATRRHHVPTLAVAFEDAERYSGKRPSLEAIAQAEERARRTRAVATEAERGASGLPNWGAIEREGAEMLRALLREANPDWVAQQVAALMGDDRNAAGRAERSLKRVLDLARPIRRKRGMDL